jgi:hypothetical protein
MKRETSKWQVQKFLSIHDQIANLFARRLYQNTATKFQSAQHSHSSAGPRSQALQ